MLCSVVDSPVLENNKWQGVNVKNVQTGEVTFLPSEALFVSIGRVPNSAIVPESVERDVSGYLVADETTRTSVPGVFAVGDLRTKPMRQVITAAADGAVASMFAQQYIEAGK